MTAMAVFLRNQMRIIAPFATLIVLVAFFSLTSRSFASRSRSPRSTRPSVPLNGTGLTKSR